MHSNLENPPDANEFLAEIAPELYAEYCQQLEADIEKCYRCALLSVHHGEQGHFDECLIFGTPEPLLCHAGPYVTEESVQKAG
mgnify:CR=1 FL=1